MQLIETYNAVSMWCYLLLFKTRGIRDPEEILSAFARLLQIEIVTLDAQR